MIIAAVLGRNDVVTTLCQHGANTDLQDINGRTVLFKAIMRGDNDVVEIILASYPNYEASKLPITLAFAFLVLLRLLSLYYLYYGFNYSLLWANVGLMLGYEVYFLKRFCKTKGGYPFLYSCLRTNIKCFNVLNYSTIGFIYNIFNMLYHLSTNEMLASDLKRIIEFWLVDETQSPAIYASCDVGSSSTDGASCKPL